MPVNVTIYFWIYTAFFFGMILSTVMVNTILLKFSTNLGTRNNDGLIRWSSNSKPALGGISFFIIYLFSMIFYVAVAKVIETQIDIELLSFLLACSLGFIMGLADDSFNTKPIIKFGVQFICTLLFIWSENYIKVLPEEWMNYLLTFLWVVGLMNSINMLDNMDAITTVVSVGILTGVLLFSITTESGDSIYTICSLGVLASLIGFLYHNWHPSKMFMGDTGSQFLGVFLAWLGIRYFWNSPDAYGHPIQSKQILMAVMIFVAPIADTFTVSLNRIKAGKSPFVGGRDHTTHHLVYNGFRERQVALIFLGITLISVFLSYNFIFYVRDWDMTDIIIWSAYVCLVIGGLYYTTMTTKAKEHMMK